MARSIVRRRTPTPTYDGIHYDARLNPNAGGRCIVKVPGSGPRVGTLTDFFTFTGGNQSLYRGAAGLLVQSVTNTPRIEYDASGNLLGLLIEGARTNLWLQSHTFDNASWTKTQCTVSANATTGPDGTASADKIVEDGTTNFHTLSQAATVVASTVYTVSFFAKPAERTWLFFDMNGGAAPGLDTAYINLGTPGYGTVGANLTSFTAQPYANGFYRFALKFTTAGATDLNCILGLATGDGGGSYAGNSASGAHVYGFQVEAGSFPSSYIPTTTVGVARTEDACARTFGGEYIKTAGTVSVEVRPADVVNTYGVFSQDANARHCYIISAPSIRAFDGTNAATAGVAPAANTFIKYAHAFDSGGQSVTANGAAIVTASYDGSWGAASTISIGAVSPGTNPMFGHIRRLSYWPERKTNADLQRLTA